MGSPPKPTPEQYAELEQAGRLTAAGPVEAVRVAPSERGHGLGAELVGWAVDAAREAGCVVVQLTTDKSRTDAHRFYERLGFVASHEGMKLPLV